ncbi:MAG TPA: TFIIB-type zinc ribbon-containing protein, partial [Armatimonadota bacterium]
MMETQFLQWRPPEGYEMVVSALDGVVVYAPKKVAETLPDQQIFKCPKCGADTVYDPAAGSVTCAHCGYQEALHAEVVGRQAKEGEFTLETLAVAAAPAAAAASPVRGWGTERRELHCDACGADLSLGPTDITTVCPFCGSNHVVNRQPAAEGLRPGFLIPFKVDAAGCAQVAREWLGRGWMFPKELAGAGNTASSQGIYLPFWTFSADIQAAWRAEVGYERTER